MKYGPDYREELDLGSDAAGEPVRLRLRLIEPGDKTKLQDALLHLSPQSQYLRFFTTKVRFTSSELAYLTEVDGRDHFALGAARLRDDGEEGDGVAIARFVRLPGEPTIAEPAIAVVDEMQHRGIGSMLMSRLVEAARERGIEIFRCEFLARNDAIRDLMSNVGPELRVEQEGPVVTADFGIGPTALSPQPPGVPDLPGSTAGSRDPLPTLLRVLSMVAQRGLELRRRFEMLLHPEELRAAWEQLRAELRDRLRG